MSNKTSLWKQAFTPVSEETPK